MTKEPHRLKEELLAGTDGYLLHEQFVREVRRLQAEKLERILGVPMKDITRDTRVPDDKIEAVYNALLFDGCSVDPSRLPTENATFGQISRCVSGPYGGD